MLPSQNVIEELFDRDLAFTMPEDYQNVQSTSAAARRLVDEMPTVVVHSGGQCTVCMEGFRSAGPAKQISCGHVFHDNCIYRWLSTRNSCPLCRRKVSAAGRLPLMQIN